MKIQLAITCLYFLCHLATAQDWYDDPQSYNGVVILIDRSTVRGDFSYNQSSELLYFENGKEVTASEALYFQCYDHKEKYNRYFFSFISSDNRFRFYEILLNGKIPLYRKSLLVEKSYVDNEKSVTNIFLGKKVVETQLYFNKNDTLVVVDNFEAQILPLMKDQIRAVSDYIVLEQLNISSKSDQLLIVDHYNRLFNKN